jgi:hypothetical protein
MSEWPVGPAEAMALGLLPSTTPVDVYAGSTATTAGISTGANGIAAGAYDFIGSVAHETTEVMGRYIPDIPPAGHVSGYFVAELFHFSAPGVRDFARGGYASPDDGVTSLNNLNLGAGGVNGDGLGDIIWQNDSGEVTVWELNGLAVTGTARLGNPGPSWRAAGLGDYNGDGGYDIRFQSTSGEAAVVELSGAAVIGGVGNPGPDWHVRAAGDVNGAGFFDILWQNDSGAVAVWELNGTAVIGGGAVANPGPSWHARGMGDVNGDGLSDVVLQNDTGEVAVWELNGTAIIAGGSVANPGPTWHA